MALSCDCDYYDDDQAKWYYTGHSKVKTIPVFKRRKRCASCKQLINPDEDVFEFRRYRNVRSLVEEWIHGDMVPLASWWTCEICSGLITAVEDLGMCFSLGDESIKDQIAEYRRISKL